MKKLIIILAVMSFILPLKVSASQLSPPDVPPSAQQYMPDNTENFAQGLWHIIKTAISKLQPGIAEAMRVCTTIIVIFILLSFAMSFTGYAVNITEMVGVIVISMILLQATKSMIILGTDTVARLTDYSKLLIPVITAAMSSQGYVTTSAALYAGTVFMNSMLSGLISGILVPLINIFLFLCIANCALKEKALSGLKNFIKWLMTWGIKIVIYVFTGYISITGVVSGSADATAIKATKLAITGVVPVVGGIISDASEAVLVSAGIVKNSMGVYGLLAIASIVIEPFLLIGVHYLLLKATTGISDVFNCKNCSTLLKEFTSAMGILLAMTGTASLLLMISVVCYMKGAA